MKRLIIILLTAVMILTSLTSCSSKRNNVNNPKSTETTLNTEGGSEKQTEPNKETEPSTSTGTYKNKMDIEAYMNYLVGYFHEPYQRGDDISENNVLYLSFLFCFYNKDNFDFIKIDEEKSNIKIPGKELQRIAENLISDSIQLSDYHSFLENNADVYSAETDMYIVAYARGYWNEDKYYLDYDENEKIKKPQITETDTELTAIADIFYCPDLGMHENVRKMEYKFDKVIYNDYLYYRLSSIKELS